MVPAVGRSGGTHCRIVKLGGIAAQYCGIQEETRSQGILSDVIHIRMSTVLVLMGSTVQTKPMYEVLWLRVCP